MSTLSIILLVLVCCIAQLICVRKAQKKWTKYIPITLTAFGFLLSILLQITAGISYKLNLTSKSVMAENQYFAMFLCILLASCFIGSLIGLLLSKIKDKKILLYFIPFILFITVYFIMAFTGFSVISIEELIWLVAFFTGGVLLSKGVVWGGVFGIIPAIAFMYMSTKYTGQTIHIELPLGIVIAVYYIVCSLVVYKCSKK